MESALDSKVDGADWRLLLELQQNARITYSESGGVGIPYRRDDIFPPYPPPPSLPSVGASPARW